MHVVLEGLVRGELGSYCVTQAGLELIGTLLASGDLHMSFQVPLGPTSYFE